MTFRLHRITLKVILSCSLCCAFCIAQAPIPTQPVPATPTSQTPVPDNQPDLAMMMAFMKPDTVVLHVGTMTLNWQELQPLVKQLTQQSAKEQASDTTPLLRTIMQRIALRGLYLQEANARDIRITNEQREANDKLLEQGLRNNPQGLTKEDIKKSFATDQSTLTKLTEEDAQRVVTLGNQLIAAVTVSEEELNQQLRATKAVREAMVKQNAVIRTQILELLNNPDSQTDKGFARIAKEHSEGVEAKNGGLMNYAFLPSELAEINHLERFDLKPGQTSGLLETPTAFRIMRVLATIPPTKDGEPERLRVAQWLFRKLPEDPENSRTEIQAQILLAKQKKAVADIGKALREKFPVTCIFFPGGLWSEETPLEK